MASEMDRIFKLLKNARLDKFYKKFIDLGIKEEQDFIDSINDVTLRDMGFSQMEMYRYTTMVNYLTRVGNTQAGEMQIMPVMKSLNEFHLFYRLPKCDEKQKITGLDPLQNTVEDLMLRICHEIDINMGVCLYTVDGMPLTDDPFFNTWSLNDRHIENGSELYAIFTPKQNLKQLPRRHAPDIRNEGPSFIRCHIMLKAQFSADIAEKLRLKSNAMHAFNIGSDRNGAAIGDFEIKVDFEHDTLREVKLRLSLESGIPETVLQISNLSFQKNLGDLGFTEDSVLHFSLSSFDSVKPDINLYFQDEVITSAMQTQKGLSVFLSTLYAVSKRHCGADFKKVIAYIRTLTGCNPLAQSLFQLICENLHITKNQMIAVVEGLYLLFRELLPGLNERSSQQAKIIEDSEVFEYANICWAYLIDQGKNERSAQENYATISLMAYPTGKRLSEPVRVPGISEVFEKSYVLEKITDGVKIPNCDEENLIESSILKATKIEMISISLPPSFDRFPLWISYHSAYPEDIPVCNFQIHKKKTFAEMCEDVKQFNHLIITPPLQLLNMGVEGPLLVFLNEDHIGVYLSKDKIGSEYVNVHDCLSGKSNKINVKDLARNLKDARTDNTFIVSKPPKEAILVLFDSSSSMEGKCYDAASQMKRIEAVKQIFDSFSNRSMAYDLPHVICLVTFNTVVKTILDFTENMETFKKHVHGIEASGCTRLYDALIHGMTELEKIKEKFPACRCRILCLTDGNDYKSKNKSFDVATKLMDKNIVVDAVLVGEADNNVLRGISYATGGYCFKPENAKSALKLLEMETVLSMEPRAERTKVPMDSIKKEEDLTNFFATHGYDIKPQRKLPDQISNKVNRTESVLKKKIRECHTGRFLKKDSRILEELKSLHCDPHPYCKVYPSETDFTFWKIIMKGPPETPYEKGVFELYCEFGPDYPAKPPVVRFITPIYHCNINNVGRICHHIFDRNYSANVNMREILDAVYGLLILPEAGDPLDSVLAEEFQTSKEIYEQAAKDDTAKNASQSMESIEKKYIGEDDVHIPPHLICTLSKQMFVDPVKTKYGNVYERKAIEEWLKTNHNDPVSKKELKTSDLKEDKNIKKSVHEFRLDQVVEAD